MSDHWNSLANFLGTPSLAPQAKKTVETTPKPKEASPTESQPRDEAVVSVEKPTPKEPSRLRSSWDAVTSFFGIPSSTATESPQERPAQPPSPVPHIPTKPNRSSSASKAKKAKPSFWDVPSSDETSDLPLGDISETNSISPDTEPIVSFGDRKRDKRDRRERASDAISDSQKNVDGIRELSSEGESAAVERRSNRRPPRRGRVSESIASPRDERHESESEDIESPHRSRRLDSRPAGRSDRPPRRDVREPRQDLREAIPSGQDEADENNRGNWRGRSDAVRRDLREPRDQRNPRDERNPKSVNAADTSLWPEKRSQSGFGAGIDDLNEDIEVDEIHAIDEFDSANQSPEDSQGRGEKRRRKRRRGKGKIRAASSESIEDERLEAQETVKKFSKVPSWSDALSGMIEINIENHQRSSHGRGDRGGRRHGPRRD